MLFLVVGGGFAIFGGYQLVTTYSFVGNASTHEAQVIKNSESCNDDGACTWWPTVTFNNSNGVAVETRTRFGASEYGWDVGAEIEILHNPNYDYVRVPGGLNLYTLGVGFFLLGMLPVLVATWLLLKWTFVVIPSEE